MTLRIGGESGKTSADDRFIELIVMDTEAVSNDIVLENEYAGATK